MRNKIKAIGLAALLSTNTAIAANPACQSSAAQAKADLLAHLEKTYEGAYSLHKMLVDKGMEDFARLCGVDSNPASDKLLNNLNKMYYPNFSLIWMLYEKNMEDYRQLHE